MRIRAISVAALAVGVVGGLSACVAPAPPTCPAAATMLAPPGNPVPPNPAPADYVAPQTVAPQPIVPVNAVSPEPPSDAAPSDLDPEIVARPPRAPDLFSGNSTPPQAGHAAPRRGYRRQTTSRQRYQELDDTQLQTQWIKPQLGAGE